MQVATAQLNDSHSNISYLVLRAALQNLDELRATVDSFDVKLLKYQKHTEVRLSVSVGCEGA